MSLRTRKRTETILALAANGLTQAQIAAKLECSVKTVQRHLERVKPALDEASEVMDEYKRVFNDIYPIEQSARDYVDQAVHGKHEAVRLGSRIRIDELRGILTDKDRARLKQDGPGTVQPMFMLPPGSTVNVTVNNVRERDEKERIIDVTPTKDEG